MSDECRHGFDAGLCAICYPPKQPERSAAERPALSRAAQRNRSVPVPRRRSSRPPSAPTTKLVDVEKQRLYHVTHVRNLPSILETGSILADAELDGGRVIDLSSAENREARRRTSVDEQAFVSEYVPFFLSPDARVWNSVRSRERNVRLAADSTDFAASDFVVLVATVGDLRRADAEFVVGDGDAVAPLTRFATTDSEVDRMLVRFALDDGDLVLSAEALVRRSVPLSSLSIIGVPSVQARESVKRLLADAGHSIKVAAYQPWFAPTPG